MLEEYKSLISGLPLSTVEYAFAYGSGNIQRNPTHYSLLRYSNIVSSNIQSKKIFQIIEPTIAIADCVLENRRSALQAAMLILPDSFSLTELYNHIVSLSYNGDFRMVIGEDKDKVKKIVDGNFEKLHKIYDPLLTEDSRVIVQNGKNMLKSRKQQRKNAKQLKKMQMVAFAKHQPVEKVISEMLNSRQRKSERKKNKSRVKHEDVKTIKSQYNENSNSDEDITYEQYLKEVEELQIIAILRKPQYFIQLN
uniref:Phosphatidate cytidylyltransferase, mitochondrial n=1 Tax=Heterorhabditis bacteriophora TaxID=37862 RepID=A0A1I7XGV6_HETBA